MIYYRRRYLRNDPVWFGRGYNQRSVRRRTSCVCRITSWRSVGWWRWAWPSKRCWTSLRPGSRSCRPFDHAASTHPLPPGGHQTDPAWRHQGPETPPPPPPQGEDPVIGGSLLLLPDWNRRQEEGEALRSLDMMSACSIPFHHFLLPSSSPLPAPARTRGRGRVQMGVFACWYWHDRRVVHALLSLTKSSDSSRPGCFEILPFVIVPFCFGLQKGICTNTSATRLESSQLEPSVPQWCYDISVSVHMAIDAVLEAACARGDVRPLWEDVPAESTRIPFGSILIFYGSCRGSSRFCKYSVHELFYSFIRSIANGHVHTVWFDFFLSRLRLRTFGGLKPIVPARPPLPPLQVCLLYVGVVWLRILSGTWRLLFNFLFGFLYLCAVDHYQLQWSFFFHGRPNFSSEDSLFYLYIYLSSSLFMFLCLLCFSRVQYQSAGEHIHHVQRFPGQNKCKNKSLQQRWNK